MYFPLPSLIKSNYYHAECVTAYWVSMSSLSLSDKQPSHFHVHASVDCCIFLCQVISLLNISIN